MLLEAATRAAGKCAKGAVLGALLALIAGCAGPDSTGFGLNVVSEGEVAQMGQQAWAELRQTTRESRNPTYRAALQRVGTRVLRGAGQDPSRWEVVVFEGKEANAFALPGGKIGVYEGMFGTAENEAQLAAVIGHEVAHVLENHHVERVNSQATAQLGAQLAGLAAQAGGLGNAQAVAALVGAGAEYGLVLPYGRNQELEADRRGLIYMARAGYDPRAAIKLWQNMQSAGGRGPEFLSTHPNPGNRIAQLEREMPEALAIYRRSR